MDAEPARTPLANPEALPWLSPEELGATLVIAPHADDESLGCGGTIARLVDLGLTVTVVFVSDGTMSHPTRGDTRPRLRALRELEAWRALEALGLDSEEPGRVAFLGLPDSGVPTEGEPGFGSAVDRVRSILVDSGAGTVLVPWRRDPHRDHRASFAITRAAVGGLGRPVRVLEYSIWVDESADPADAPRWGEVVALRVGVADVLPRKRLAIAAHRSQTTDLIDDDPAGFRLSAATLARFDRPWEVFLESPP